MNRQIRLAARPTGLPSEETWELTEEAVAPLGEGDAQLEVHYLSLDPAMRGWLNEGKSYIAPVGIGDVMRAGGVGRVVASNSPRLAVGDYAQGITGVQEQAVLPADQLTPVDPGLAPLPTYLGVLGMPGMTAYFGLLDVAAAREGDTVVVSGAAGAVGSVVGQIAKLKGCRAVGIAGGARKCAWVVDDLGFDACVDYKADNLYQELRAAAPDGIDVYFDNVGGEILDVCLAQLRRGARVALCGAISQYNATDGMRGPSNYLSLLVNRARMEGFVVFDFAKRYKDAAQEIAGWIGEGRVIAREDVVDGGVEDFPATLLKLFSGENTGKLVLKIAG